MNEVYVVDREGIDRTELEKAVDDVLSQYPDLKKVLIVPPDYTRCYSYAGEITRILYRKLTAAGAVVNVIPALGTHMPMNDEELSRFFGNEVPKEDILIHHWQTDTVKLGVIPADEVKKITDGLFDEEVDVEVNHLLLDGGYDRIFSVGQVVPHEVVGMANYSKNLFVGLGGRSMINKSHFISAVCGIEQTMGEVDCPARQLFDYAQQHYIDGKIPVTYMLTVVAQTDKNVSLLGFFAGESRKAFEEACRLSRKENIIHLDRRAKKMVVYLDPDELKTTWVGNKAIYRTRKELADGGELIILAPGVKGFGENDEVDAAIRKYGYRGRDYVLDLYRKGAFENMLMCAAHLIHGSSDGRFSITYATRPENLSKEDVESVGFKWADYEETAKHYDPAILDDGWHIGDDGEEFYYVGKPALGLWECDD